MLSHYPLTFLNPCPKILLQIFQQHSVALHIHLLFVPDECFPLVAEFLGMVYFEVLAAFALDGGEQASHRELVDVDGRNKMLDV